jgi:hypothetical protein
VCYLCLTDLTLRSYESGYVAVRMLCDLIVPVARLENHNINTAINLDAAPGTQNIKVNSVCYSVSYFVVM